MQAPIEARLRGMETRRDELLERYRSLSREQLEFRPEPGAWSLLEVAEHVLLSEQLGFDYMQKKIPHLEPGQRLGWRSRVVFPLLRGLLALPVRVRMPGPVVSRIGPRGEIGLDQLEDEWTRLHREWRGLLEGLDPALAGAPAFRHPVAGRLTAEEALHFFAVHFDHHQAQIERLLRHPDFPAS